MDMVLLTCKNHPDLRWACKEIAWSDGYGYNGHRRLHYHGSKDNKQYYPDVPECECSARDLMCAPESKGGRS